MIFLNSHRLSSDLGNKSQMNQVFTYSGTIFAEKRSNQRIMYFYSVKFEYYRNAVSLRMRIIFFSMFNPLNFFSRCYSTL
jgi:hypothetical protein